ncbi:MAG: hypothetical protein RLY86_2775 [Pseudomonadota bacterium]|jgi:pimeloyl-ACP methyl ester carboxylesterase
MLEQDGGGIDGPIHSLTRGAGRIAYRHSPGAGPTIVFLGGFRSDMTGTKARALHAWAAEAGRSFLRFDYQGHGASSGDWDACTIGLWLDDALAVIDGATAGKLVLVGSSMGGWIATLAAMARPDRIAGLVTIAAAPDFTERLIWDRLDPAARARMLADGFLVQPSAYDPAGYRITRTLVEEGRRHLILGGTVPVTAPVRLLHGMRDTDVPHELSLELAGAITWDDVRITLVKDGDHRLSRDPDIALLLTTVAELR